MRVLEFWRRRLAKRAPARKLKVQLHLATEWVQGPATVELKHGQFAYVLSIEVGDPLRKASEA